MGNREYIEYIEYIDMKYLVVPVSTGYHYCEHTNDDDIVRYFYKELGLIIYYSRGSANELLGYEYNNNLVLGKSDGRGVTKYLNWLEPDKTKRVEFYLMINSLNSIIKDLRLKGVA